MRAQRRSWSLLFVLLLAGGCARGARVKPVPEAAGARYRTLMDEAGRAGREGRTAEALAKYLDVAGSSGAAALSSEAYLQAGLLRLGADVTMVDVAEATRLLRESRARLAGAAEPLVLTATLTALDRLQHAEQAAQEAVVAAGREAARRDEEARALRRTISSLRQQVEKKDDALRKAAEAAVGRSR